jgi:hypothetical protein
MVEAVITLLRTGNKDMSAKVSNKKIFLELSVYWWGLAQSV